MNVIVPNMHGARPVLDPGLALTVEHLRVNFGNVQAIDGIDLAIRQGEFVSLIGPSGCGKSTLLRVVAGLVTPSSGAVERTSAGLEIGFMFQKPLLLPWRKTIDNVLLPIELQTSGRVNAEARDRAVRMLALVQLADFAEAYPHQLSGGMQQRVALARTLMRDPDILLLDEPFGALDELTRDVLNEELLRIWDNGAVRRATILMVTHSIPEAVAMSDRVLVLSARPARLVEDVAITSPRPRRPDDPNIAAVARHLRQLLRQPR